MQTQPLRPTETIDFKQLHIEELRSGNGPAVTEQSRIRVHFTQWLMEGGKKIDSSYDRLVPDEWTLNDSHLITGLKKGILGMKAGGKRKLIIPPDYAYGKKSVGGVPPNAHLVFEIEILEILPTTPMRTPTNNELVKPPTPQKNNH